MPSSRIHECAPDLGHTPPDQHASPLRDSRATSGAGPGMHW
jgi:hypothetical protein